MKTSIYLTAEDKEILDTLKMLLHFKHNIDIIRYAIRALHQPKGKPMNAVPRDMDGVDIVYD